MLINKRLVALLGKVKLYIFGIVGFQWIALLANIAMIMALVYLLQSLFTPQSPELPQLPQLPQQLQPALTTALLAFGTAAIIRAICTVAGSKMSYLTTVQVKTELRSKIYQKVLALGAGYTQNTRTAEIVQVAGEGVDQLESYFGRYLPQLFYSALAPITLFAALAFVNLSAAAVLLIATPLILVAIMAVSKMARKIFAKYWGIYTDLGANFLENLQGLTTLKIYQATDNKLQEMSSDAQTFRTVTMKVLQAQLGSIAAMDFVAFGGAAVGIIVAIFQFQTGAVTFAGCLAIILLSAEFFIPMRQLGSYFHIAMNGVAASDKIFALLDQPQTKTGQLEFECQPSQIGASLQNLTFSYDTKPVLQDITINVLPIGLTSIVGKSGSGKSTLAQALIGGLSGYLGAIKLNDTYEVRDLSEQCIMENITKVTSNSHIFKGTVRENLIIACPKASDSELWRALNRVKLDDFLRSQDGLDTQLAEAASNLSGGQRQRLALARALLHDTPFYIFDEATSNIDAQSEALIMDTIHDLARDKAVLLISHRLANVLDSQIIYVLQDSRLVEQGSHNQLLANRSYYASLYAAQSDLENFTKSSQAPANQTSSSQPQVYRTNSSQRGAVPKNDAYKEVSTCAKTK